MLCCLEDSIILSAAVFGHWQAQPPLVIDVHVSTRAQLSHPTLPASKITHWLHISVTYQQGFSGHQRLLFTWLVFDFYPRTFSPSHLGSKVNSTKALVANSGCVCIYVYTHTYSIYTLKQLNTSWFPIKSCKKYLFHYLTANKAP